MKKHYYGHVTGTIKNTGEHTAYYPKMFAIANGHDGILDVVQNLEYIEKMEPVNVREFSMYVDPSITDEIFYYSCFAVTDSFVRPWVIVNASWWANDLAGEVFLRGLEFMVKESTLSVAESQDENT